MSEKIVQLNEEVIKGQLKEMVRGSVEETLNELLEKEAESLTQAARYERNEARQGYRSGHYDRSLTTTSGDVTLHMPRLKGVAFETAIIERYRRRESSVEEALIEMYLAGVSVRRVEDITEALWGSKVSASTISELNKKAYVNIEAWRNRVSSALHGCAPSFNRGGFLWFGITAPAGLRRQILRRWRRPRPRSAGSRPEPAPDAGRRRCGRCGAAAWLWPSECWRGSHSRPDPAR